jgi:CheY-like chemotaxis protein/signal transduction histidine kinase
MINNRKKIIVVDDNLENLTALKETLKEIYEVYPCPSAFKMFDLLEHIMPDLILLDVEMPEMDGYEAAKKLKESEKYKRIHIMFITSRNDEKSEIEALELGAVDYIHKPFVGPLLIQRIRAFLSLIDYEEKEISQRGKLLDIVNSAANILLSVSDEDSFETALSDSFKLVGECVDADRVQIWQNKMINGELHFVRGYEWLSEYGCNCTPVPLGLHFPYKDMPEWESLFLRGECINASFSQLSKKDHTLLDIYEIKSIVMIPIFLERKIKDNNQSDGSFWGFFSLDNCHKERVFSEEEMRLLSSVALMMGNAVNRYLQNAKIREENTKSINMAHWYESILNAISLPISVTDVNANWAFMNKALEDYFDITYKEALGKPCSSLQTPICNTEECGIECAKKGLKQTYISYGDLFYEVSIETLKNINDKEIGYIEIMHDITNLKTMAKKQADAEAANIAKSAFLARMSHEIRSPMNVILGVTEMQLDKEGLSPDVRDAFGKVHNSGYMLLKVINDILDLSKIEADKLELSSVNYDVASLINDIVQLTVTRFESKPIEFELRADEHLPVTLVGDELRIKQILNNIVTNAFKYTDSGKVTMSVSTEYKMSEQGEEPYMMLIFRISDTGQGMTREQVDKLFDEYTRFNLEANRVTEGTGLGMSITKRLVYLMNGNIEVKSEPGKGSVFTIWLPQGIVAGAGVFGKEMAEKLSNFNYSSNALIKKTSQVTREYMPYGKILIVDDMEPNLYVARGLMSPYGLSIETAATGVEAVNKIKNGAQFDIIFMDHFMPEMDGIEAAKIIRELGYKQPIVALTANAVSGQAEMFLSEGFDGFISKPIDIRQLNETLNRMVRDKYPAETVETARRLKESLMRNTDAVKLDLSYMKALVVDDFMPNLNVAAGMLRKYKMYVDCALSGQEAINRIKSGEHIYDFIFMDHLMPEMDGIETTRQIRSLDTEYAKNVPIIALTADASSGDGQIFFDNGFQAFLPKPLSLAKLDIFIRNWIREKIANDINVLNKKEKEMIIEIQGIEHDKIMELYDGDLDIFLPVLRSYLSAIPAALEKMRSVSAETLEDYKISVHGVKSTSESIGAEKARKMAAELEAMAKAGDLPGILDKNETLISYVEELLVGIKAWLAASDKGMHL